MEKNRARDIAEDLFGEGGFLEYPHWVKPLTKKRLNQHIGHLSMFLVGLIYGGEMSKSNIEKIINEIKEDAKSKKV